jgi:hypothetical protein
MGASLFGDGFINSALCNIRLVTKAGINEDVMQSYICLFNEETNNFFVKIGLSPVEGFVKSTFINIMKLASNKGATKVYFIVDRDNQDKTEYRKAFKLIDLKRVSSDEKQAIFKQETDYLVYAIDTV